MEEVSNILTWGVGNISKPAKKSKGGGGEAGRERKLCAMLGKGRYFRVFANDNSTFRRWTKNIRKEDGWVIFIKIEMNPACVFVLSLFVDKATWKVIHENCPCRITHHARFMNEKLLLSNEKNCHYFPIHTSEENHQILGYRWRRCNCERFYKGQTYRSNSIDIS